jgi:hypothetical protein
MVFCSRDQRYQELSCGRCKLPVEASPLKKRTLAEVWWSLVYIYVVIILVMWSYEPVHYGLWSMHNIEYSLKKSQEPIRKIENVTGEMYQWKKDCISSNENWYLY